MKTEKVKRGQQKWSRQWDRLLYKGRTKIRISISKGKSWGEIELRSINWRNWHILRLHPSSFIQLAHYRCLKYLLIIQHIIIFWNIQNYFTCNNVGKSRFRLDFKDQNSSLHHTLWCKANQFRLGTGSRGVGSERHPLSISSFLKWEAGIGDLYKGPSSYDI